MNSVQLNELANKGVAWAQARLGTYAIQGIEGVEQSLERAYELLESAAKSNHKQAQLDAGLMNLEGIGCEKNTDKGIGLLKKSAMQFNSDAQLRLANYYLTKTKDYKAAYFFYLLHIDCSENLSKEEQESLAMIREHLNEETAKATFSEAKVLIDNKPDPTVELLEYSGVYLSMVKNQNKEAGIDVKTEPNYFPPALEVAKEVIGQISGE